MIKKVLVYGLGREFALLRELITTNYEVVGYSDRRKVAIEGYIDPVHILDIEWDAVFITSVRFYDEIKENLQKILGGGQIVFLSRKDLIGTVENVQTRNEWVISQLSKIAEGKYLLDAGAGESKYEKYCSHLHYIAQDFGEYKPETSTTALQSRKWIYPSNYIKCDITDMPLEKESMDVVLCTEVLEHIQDPILALREFSRIVKKGGKVILTAPFASLVHMAPYYYSSGFSRYWYEENLNAVGFNILEIQSYGDYFSWLGQEVNRLSSMVKRYLDYEMNDEEEKTVYKMLHLLKKLGQKDNRSDELLCFGYMVVAEKVKG